jgi:hypothetical protein
MNPILQALLVLRLCPRGCPATGALALLLATLLLAACNSTTPTPSGDLQVLDGILPGDGVVRFTPFPKSGTPEADPHMILYGYIADDTNGKPLQADTVLVGWEGEELDIAYRDVDQFKIVLPGQALDTIRVDVQAQGYQLWSQGLRYELQHTREFTIVVRLKPEQ